MVILLEGFFRRQGTCVSFGVRTDSLPNFLYLTVVEILLAGQRISTYIIKLD